MYLKYMVVQKRKPQITQIYTDFLTGILYLLYVPEIHGSAEQETTDYTDLLRFLPGDSICEPV